MNKFKYVEVRKVPVAVEAASRGIALVVGLFTTWGLNHLYTKYSVPYGPDETPGETFK